MDGDYESQRTFNFKTIKTEFTDSYSSPLLEIKFKFLFENKLSHWILDKDSSAAQCVRECHLPMIEFLVHLNLQKLLSYEETREEIDRQLMPLPVSDDERNRLIEFAWNEAMGAVRSKSISCYATLHLHLSLVVETRSIRGFESCLAGSLVRMLKKHDDIDHSGMDTEEICCCICLEDLSEEEGGGDILELPCTHVFHDDCIQKWLRTANTCPLCRFELPEDYY